MDLPNFIYFFAFALCMKNEGRQALHQNGFVRFLGTSIPLVQAGSWTLTVPEHSNYSILSV